MAIEIRSFNGDPDELADFVTRHWRVQYAVDGFAPTLSGAYFQWMMPTFAAGDASNIIAAYEGAKLVGVMPSDPLSLNLRGEPAMTLARGYLTVDSERLRFGIGRMLREGLAKRCRALGARFATGFVNSGRLTGKGRAFWGSMSNQVISLRRPRQWVRLLNGAAVSAASHDNFDRLAALVGGAIGGLSTDAQTKDVRPFATTDLPECHNLFSKHMRMFDMAYEWDETRLAHHLAFPGPASTHVYDDNGTITGFATCYVFDITGRKPMRNAILDLVMPAGQSLRQKMKLLAAVTEDAMKRGAHLAIVLGPPVNPSSVLLTLRFLPLPSSYHLLLAVFEPEPRLNEVQRPFALFR